MHEPLRGVPWRSAVILRRPSSRDLVTSATMRFASGVHYGRAEDRTYTLFEKNEILRGGNFAHRAQLGLCFADVKPFLLKCIFMQFAVG